MNPWLLFLCLCPALMALGLNDPINIKVENGCIQATPPARIVLDRSAADGEKLWDIVDNYENHLRIENGEYFGRKAMILSCPASARTDTAFDLSTGPLSSGTPAMYHIEFEVAASMPTGGFCASNDKYRNRIVFFDQSGKQISEKTFSYVAPLLGYEKITLACRFPESATALSLHLGGDEPDIRKNQFVAYSSLRIRYFYEQGDWARSSFFSSSIFPLRKTASSARQTIEGKSSGAGARIQFQIACAGDQNGFPDSFDPFAGPDGKEDQWYENGAELTELPVAVRWIRYRAKLLSGDTEPAKLTEIILAGQRDTGWTALLDITPPKAFLASQTPVADGSLPVKVRLTDESGIDWAVLRVKLDGKNIRAKITATEDGFQYHPDTPFSQGLHQLQIKARDLSGNKGHQSLFFLIGKTAVNGIVTLRNDGMTLVDGKPFFPIGIYNVWKCPANDQNFDRAFRELKEAGFNFVQTYQTTRNANFREFMDTARKYGFKVWIAGQNSSNDANLKWIAKSLMLDRLNPALLAWYIGDDTATYNTPEQLQERTELVRALAPHLITVHADSLREKKVSRYRPFVRSSLAFMPEIYPITQSPHDPECVAKVLRDVKQAVADVRETHSAPRTIWPIIQYFQGWKMWKRFPTSQELRGMSYAAIIAGAHGLTWYRYAGYNQNYCATSTPERWAVMSSLSKEIAGLTPILIEHDAELQIRPEIISGAKINAKGDISIQALTKLHHGKCYVFTVNSVSTPVKARFSVKNHRTGRTILPEQNITISAGFLAADFKPFEVKIFELQ